MRNPRLVIVSNRGPVGFTLDDDGRPVAGSSAGGLATGLKPLLGAGTTWIAAAVSDADRVAARRGDGTVDVDGLGVRMLDLPEDRYRAAYDVVSNATLWFLHHGLWDLPRRPVFDAAWHEAWKAYREVNGLVADAVVSTVDTGAASGGESIVLVQDYHLALLGRELAERGVTVPVVHFSHTPFAGAESIGVLPERCGRELLESMAAFTGCGFHTGRWARRFVEACRELDIEPPPTFTADLAPDLVGVRSIAAGDACGAALDALEATIGDRDLVVRVDRLELSKNVLRGFLAWETLLERRTDLRGTAVFGAFMYRSREGVEDYHIYEEQVRDLVARINARFASRDWEPIVLEIGDDYPRAIAALRRYDVLLVNPVRDGLNLVAFEGPGVNERDGAVCLSTGAGAFDSLAGVVEELDPFDTESTAAALERALALPATERAARAGELRRRIEERTPARWLDAQVAAAHR